jgi:hypothetical protein
VDVLWFYRLGVATLVELDIREGGRLSIISSAFRGAPEVAGLPRFPSGAAEARKRTQVFYCIFCA